MNFTRRHLRFGWWSLLGFLILGLALELLRGFKVGLYLDVPNETRRLMWTLAHAHGALLGLVHIAFAVSLTHLPGLDTLGRTRAAKSARTDSGVATCVIVRWNEPYQLSYSAG